MLTARDVLNIDFTTTQIRRGYDEGEVDAFLDRVVQTLRYYEAGGSPVDAPDPGPRPASRDASADLEGSSDERSAEEGTRPHDDPSAEDGGGLGTRLGRLLRGDPSE